MTLPEGNNQVVVGVDGSAASTAAVRWAAATAAARDLVLRIVHVIDFSPTGYAGAPYVESAKVFEWAEEDGRVMLSDAAAVARAVAPDVRIETTLVPAGGSHWFVEESARARMIVLGASGSGRIGQALLGSTPIVVASHGHCPVVVVRGDEPDPTAPVVVGVDGSPISERAVAAAFEEASQRGVPLVAVHVWSDVKVGTFSGADRAELLDPRAFEDSEQVLLAERLSGYCERYPDVVVHREVYLDGPRLHLQAWSEKAQLVVVGSRGRGGFTGLLLGSTGNGLIREAHCPVMVVRPA
ncbi:universal stress protein [Rhodococcus sp. HM1]|uniref:universal stress protein n=1 Tax=unclassified Rhodococcus (in: high G+C Gram-positive bacteria) TaxID=192944 RepID=UPI00200A7E68|nr:MULTISPECIES: universal stress protein [unclassified Rhodococcus (in: high G+C Gram-positive bacteria)]MCK8674174.1 universal stress protein [Rhodococcus sp. HM1]